MSLEICDLTNLIHIICYACWEQLLSCMSKELSDMVVLYSNKIDMYTKCFFKVKISYRRIYVTGESYLSWSLLMVVFVNVTCYKVIALIKRVKWKICLKRLLTQSTLIGRGSAQPSKNVTAYRTYVTWK